ncbi:hypothetical protein PVW51_14635 [Sulfitobacter sp. PR48]|nr:hypothetical protein [Sulfitobacter sp. PR48]
MADATAPYDQKSDFDRKKRIEFSCFRSAATGFMPSKARESD